MTAVIPDLLFHGKGPWRVAASAGARSPAGSCRTATEGLEIGATQKNPLAERLGFFCMEPNSFGVTRGEQPLFHGSSALKSL